MDLKNTLVSNSLKLSMSHLVSENTIFRWKMRTFPLLFGYSVPTASLLTALSLKDGFSQECTAFILRAYVIEGTSTGVFSEESSSVQDLEAERENHAPSSMVLPGLRKDHLLKLTQLDKRMLLNMK